MRNSRLRSDGLRRPDVLATLCVLVFLVAGGQGRPAGGEEDSAPASRDRAAGVVTGFTAPFRTVTLSAVRTGRIEDIPVTEGDFVGTGTDAVQLDDAVQRRRVEIARARAESTLDIEMARVRLWQAQQELERVKSLDGDSYASAKELDDAQAEADAARLALEQAGFQHEQAAREHALQQALLDELRLRAPFPAYVAERLKEVGDTVEEREGILTLVQLDPLVVAVDCSLELSPRIYPGQRVTVRPVGGPAEPRIGEVFFVSRVADPASQTLKVKILVPNPDTAWVVGMRVDVDVQREPPVSPVTAGPQPEADAAQAAAPKTRAPGTTFDDER